MTKGEWSPPLNWLTLLMTSSENLAWSDSPLAHADISGRPAFASAVAARISATPLGASSTVFGLVGPWGGGKTTLLHDIASQLQGAKVWFSPWSAVDVPAIAGEFVAALAEAFPQSKSLKSKLSRYSRFGIPLLKAVPVAGESAFGFAELVLDEIAPRPTWHTEFEAISKEIGEQGKKVLVIVDDVDRLDANELRALLRVIRLLGRFRDVHYLIAYDQATIDHLLDASGMSGRSSAFMEKIVQYPFAIPPAPAIERRRWARAIVTLLVPEQAQLSEELRVPTEDLIKVLAAGLETPRAAERLREQISTFVELATQAELDGLDFIVVTWLRIAHHNVWDHVRTHSDEFLGWSGVEDDKARMRQLSEIGNLVQHGKGGPVWDAVRFLFDSGNGWFPSVGRKRGIRSPRYFDRYFLMGLADDDVSDAKTQTAVDQLIGCVSKSPEIELFSHILHSNDGERAALALNIGRESRQDDTSSVALVKYLSRRRDELEQAEMLNDFRQSPLETWLAREIALALASNALSTDEAVDRFGYDFLVASAYWVKHSARGDGGLVKTAFSGLAENWIGTIGHAALEEMLKRPESVSMLSLCAWLESGLGHGVLEPFIYSADDLIRAGQMFVTNSLLGHSVEQDVVFNEWAFRWGVGSALGEHQAALPAPNDGLFYEVTGRQTGELAAAELRDFTVRRLRELTL
jgi:hypothetical protein